jgi:hypothetical protein
VLCTVVLLPSFLHSCSCEGSLSLSLTKIF